MVPGVFCLCLPGGGKISRPWPYFARMRIAAIVAVSQNGIIGDDNQIPWYLPTDLNYFKRVTLGHPVIMGRKNFQSIGRPLPKRLNIVLTRSAFWRADGVEIANSASEALQIASDSGAQSAFIIGGADIYSLFWAQTQTLYYTEVHVEVEGDVRFPGFDLSEWQLLSSEHHEADAKNEFAYTFKVYERLPD